MWSQRSTASHPARQAPAAQWEPGPGPSLARTPTGTSLRATRPPHWPRWAGRGSSWSWPLTDAVEAELRQCSLWCPRGSPIVSSGSWRVPGAFPWARGCWSPSISSPVRVPSGLVKACFRASGTGSVLCARPSPPPPLPRPRPPPGSSLPCPGLPAPQAFPRSPCLASLLSRPPKLLPSAASPLEPHLRAPSRPGLRAESKVGTHVLVASPQGLSLPPAGDEWLRLKAVVGYNGNGRTNLVWSPDTGVATAQGLRGACPDAPLGPLPPPPAFLRGWGGGGGAGVSPCGWACREACHGVLTHRALSAHRLLRLHVRLPGGGGGSALRRPAALARPPRGDLHVALSHDAQVPALWPPVQAWS